MTAAKHPSVWLCVTVRTCVSCILGEDSSSGRHTFRGLFEGEDVVLGFRLESGLGLERMQLGLWCLV